MLINSQELSQIITLGVKAYCEILSPNLQRLLLEFEQSLEKDEEMELFHVLLKVIFMAHDDVAPLIADLMAPLVPDQVDVLNFDTLSNIGFFFRDLTMKRSTLANFEPRRDHYLK